MIPAKFECGEFLDRCQCVSAVKLNPAAMQQRHEASVARAKRSDAGLAPAGDESPSMRGRRISKSQRTQQRATSDGAMLLNILRRAS